MPNLKKLFKTLSFRVSLFIFFLSALAYLVGNFMFFNIQEHYYIKSFLREKEIFTKNLSLAISEYLLLSDYASLETFLLRMAENPDIIEITLYGRDGKSLFTVFNESNGGKEGKPKVILEKRDRNLPQEIKPLVIKENHSLTFLFPLLKGDVGWFSISYYLEIYRSLFKKSFWYSFLFNLFIGIIVFTILILFINIFSQKLRVITQFAKNLSLAKGESLSLSSSIWEIDELIQALNTTSKKLYKSEKELMTVNLYLEELNKNLEKRVEEEVRKSKEKDFILAHQARLAAMGEMLSAIAHQWRQPLNTLGLILQDLLDAQAYGELTSKYLKDSVEKGLNQIKFMSRTIEDFRNFFRPSKEKEIFEVEEAIANVLRLLSAQFRNHNINFQLTCLTHNKVFERVEDIIVCGDHTILGYKNEFEHVILNILNNAKDAFLEREKTHSFPEKRIEIEVDRIDDRVIIRIRDNAGGIPEDIIDRIFDPYFTTKEKGTGIGLYMSKMIIENNMGGKIQARNVEGGAEILIELPNYQEEILRS